MRNYEENVTWHSIEFSSSNVQDKISHHTVGKVVINGYACMTHEMCGDLPVRALIQVYSFKVSYSIFSWLL